MLYVILGLIIITLLGIIFYYRDKLETSTLRLQAEAESFDNLLRKKEKQYQQDIYERTHMLVLEAKAKQTFAETEADLERQKFLDMANKLTKLTVKHQRYQEQAVITIREADIARKKLENELKLLQFSIKNESSTSDISQVNYFNIINIVKDDAASYWLTPDEYQKLPSAIKYQRALERYQKRKKTNWEIGQDYERYIGYLYEQKGYKVQYFGIKHGKEDLGRDLICKKGHRICIVQCKCWSKKKNKLIHENLICQHFGSTLEYYLSNISDNPNAIDFFNRQTDLFHKDTVIPVFISTVPYSDTAREFARKLKVVCRVVQMHEYPMIKCHVNKKANTRIYYLPFDKRYDTCGITLPDDFYAKTISEAETKGFRRAKPWHKVGQTVPIISRTVCHTSEF